MKKCVFKRLQYIALIYSLLGFTCLSFSSIFRDGLSNFQRGFFEGAAVVMIIIWAVYMIWSFLNKRNPYEIIK